MEVIMIIPLSNIIKDFKLDIKGVIHIGAHYGQEYSDYIKNGIQNMIFFEPIKSNFQKLMDNLQFVDGNIHCHNMALGNQTGVVEMFVETENKGQSCSVLKPELHLKHYPKITFKNTEKVFMNKLDSVDFNRDLYNMINIDVQGYELEVFKGATEVLKNIDIIYTEINAKELYKDCVLVGDLDFYLRQFGFERVLTKMTKYDWGDALYLKN
jgi:FkbM family methyltransferase